MATDQAILAQTILAQVNQGYVSSTIFEEIITENRAAEEIVFRIDLKRKIYNLMRDCFFFFKKKINKAVNENNPLRGIFCNNRFRFIHERKLLCECLDVCSSGNRP